MACQHKCDWVCGSKPDGAVSFWRWFSAADAPCGSRAEDYILPNPPNKINVGAQPGFGLHTFFCLFARSSLRHEFESPAKRPLLQNTSGGKRAGWKFERRNSFSVRHDRRLNLLLRDGLNIRWFLWCNKFCLHSKQKTWAESTTSFY